MLRLSNKNYFQAFLFTLVDFSIFVNHKWDLRVCLQPHYLQNIN